MMHKSVKVRVQVVGGSYFQPVWVGVGGKDVLHLKKCLECGWAENVFLSLLTVHGQHQPHLGGC